MKTGPGSDKQTKLSPTGVEAWAELGKSTIQKPKNTTQFKTYPFNTHIPVYNKFMSWMMVLTENSGRIIWVVSFSLISSLMRGLTLQSNKE